MIFQSSIFVYAARGFIEPQYTIKIKAEYKARLLIELKEYYNIYIDTIYNDLQGFIANTENYKSNQVKYYIALYKE